ncbi:unnamed protein product [Aphis gossypii]|uniref:Uncharacterized protein n=1 Tax=Aphis gossypii TaxID=80765 RepID=A0A9P0J7B9_APHGO|nr:unnamed protein product [Aphis gossypii]
MWLFHVQVSESGIHCPSVGGIHGCDNQSAFSIVLVVVMKMKLTMVMNSYILVQMVKICQATNALLCRVVTKN